MVEHESQKFIHEVADEIAGTLPTNDPDLVYRRMAELAREQMQANNDQLVGKYLREKNASKYAEILNYVLRFMTERIFKQVTP